MDIAGNFKRAQPLFSIVVTCFNQARFITECLDSIKKQNYEPIELIICDDNSTDNSVSIIKEWASSNSINFYGVKIIKNENNLGIAGNHNVGLSKASGKYISFIHGDDLLHDKEVISLVLEYLKSNYLKFCATRYQPFLDRGFGEYKDLTPKPSKENLTIFELKPETQFSLLCKKNIIPGIMVFSTSFLKKIGGFDERFRINEDWAMWLFLTKKGYQIKCFPKPFIYYRRHSQAITISSFEEGNCEFFKYKLKIIEKYIKPYENELSLPTRWSILINKLYIKKMINHGCSKAAHKRARLIKILDPLELIKNKLAKLINS